MRKQNEMWDLYTNVLKNMVNDYLLMRKGKIIDNIISKSK